MRRTLVLIICLVARLAPAQQRGLTVERIFASSEFASVPFPTIRWMRDGRSYLDIRKADGGGTDLVKVDLVTGATTVLVEAAAIAADGQRIEVEDARFSSDESAILLFHHSVRVWRSNTRGEYGVYDIAARRLIPLVRRTGPRAPVSPKDPSFLASGLASGAADPDLQMFAKFSPDGRQVAFVRANNLWVTELQTGRSTRLTTDGSDDIINGTTDWVYEEELGLRDAFRWSPDGRRLAYWQFDQRDVPAFPIVDETSLYPSVSILRYPKAGASNSRVRVGVVAAGGGETKWLSAGPDTGAYLARMDWVDADTVVVTRLPRRQDRVELLMLSASSGEGRAMLVDSDSAYVGASFTDVPGRRCSLAESGSRVPLGERSHRVASGLSLRPWRQRRAPGDERRDGRARPPGGGRAARHGVRDRGGA
jgi:dipeptidyl-peptidase 4